MTLSMLVRVSVGYDGLCRQTLWFRVSIPHSSLKSLANKHQEACTKMYNVALFVTMKI